MKLISNHPVTMRASCLLFSAPLVLFVAWAIASMACQTLKQLFLSGYLDLPEPIADFLFTSFIPNPGTRTRRLERDSALEMTDHHCHDPTENMPWASYGSGPGAMVNGFPSTGGLYVLFPCFGIELDFLGLDRFNETPRPSKSYPDWMAKEDAHCDRSKSDLLPGQLMSSGTILVKFSSTWNGANVSLISAPSRRYLVANAGRGSKMGIDAQLGIRERYR